MKKARINRVSILDKFHKGAVCACIGVTLYGTFLLGTRVYHHFAVIRPEIKRHELKKIEEEDKTPELKY